MDDLINIDDVAPCGVTPDDVIFPPGFSHETDGLWYTPPSNGKRTRISGPFRVVGLGRDPKNGSWSICLEWNDQDARQHVGFVQRADLIGESVDALRPLVARGLLIESSRESLRLFKQALYGVKCVKRLRLVFRAGWFDHVFVLPHVTIGDYPGEKVIYHGEADAAHYAQKGTLEDWKERVAKPCAGNSRLLLALAAAFAGPLNDLLQGEGGGFHFYGSSSVGKTTLAVLAGSVWGGGGRTGFIQTWRSTDNALESVAQAHSGTILVLDELGEFDPAKVGPTSYMLANGQGKVRANRKGVGQPRHEWRVQVLSTGEVTLADKIREGGKPVKAGQTVRIIDVPADAGAGFGLFEITYGVEPAAFAKSLKEVALEVYGTAGPEFVAALAADPEGMAKTAREMMKAISERLLATCKNPDGQIVRVAERLALVAAAGELARVYLGLPWAEGEVEWAASACFAGWREQRGGNGSGELLQALGAVREVIQKDVESRFRHIGRGTEGHDERPLQQGPIRDLLGYRFNHEGRVVFGFTANGWKEVVGQCGRPSDLARMLAKRGVLLTTNAEDYRLTKRVGDTKHALVAVYADAVLEESE
ncbi:MAG TPA: DUF927 domain-containing protein [Microvirga sp.]|jgi:putative DNA primase/helicase